MNPKRWLMVLAVAVVAVGVVVVDVGTDPSVTVTAEPLDRLTPTMAAAGAGTSTWYCAAGTATGDDTGEAEQTLLMTNTTTDDRTAVVTVYGDDGGDPVAETVELPAGARTALRVSQVRTADWAGALVEADGGGVAVDHVLTGPTGQSAGPCASSVSATWYLPAGATVLGVDHQVVLFNPFGELAVVDVSVETADGRRIPPGYEGLIVPARSVRVLDISSVVTVRDQVAVVVAARSGLVVAEQVEASGPESDLPTSLAVTLGAPAPQTAWYYPLGAPVGDGVTHQYVVFNPTADLADVDVQVLAGTGDFIEPFAVTVRPGQFVVVDLADDDRVPRDVAVAAYVESRNGVAVVAARVLRSTGSVTGDGTGASVAGPGASITVGAPLVATGWVVPLGGVRGGDGAGIGISNLGLRDATVEVTVLRDGTVAAVDGAFPVTVPAGRVVTVDIGAVSDAGAISVVVASDQPVAVERGVVFTDGRGYARAVAIAVGGTVQRPAVASPDTATSPTVVLDGLTTLPPASAPPTTPATTSTTAATDVTEPTVATVPS